MVKHTTRPLKPGADHLVAFIVNSGNIAATQKTLNRFFDRRVTVSKNFAEKGAKNLHLTADRKFLFLGSGKSGAASLEDLRKSAFAAVNSANELKAKKLTLVMEDKPGDAALTALAESAALSNYQFLIYKTEQKKNTLRDVHVFTPDKGDAAAVTRGKKIADATCIARDLVNEPVNSLNATELAKRAETLASAFGLRSEVLNKARIQALKMGGLLAVNAGSIDPPTFTVLEWKPKNARNKKPIVLLGKGVTYDTGGLSLKETPGSMDQMKCDMAGAAAVLAALCGIASLNLPLHVIGLMPATDNRPGENAMAPGDIITMFDGTTVEMLNADAEGRMLLADGLAYAKKFNPGLVIDLATLTGAAIIVIGYGGTVMTSTATDAVTDALMASGERVNEKLVRLPLWDEFKDLLKSDIADMKNIGGKPAGSITPAKFLEHFTDYPWIHLDIAGPAFITAADSYRGKWGTGVGVRLLLDFLETYDEN